MTDWLPTLYTAGGGHMRDLGPVDGVDQWRTLTEAAPSSRREVLIDLYKDGRTGALR